MDKYINADKLLRTLPDDLPYKASVKRVLIQAPAEEVAKVRHGYWEYSKIDDKIYCGCSECHEEPECFEPRYCPNCGTIMDRTDGGSLHG